jgi:type 1 glutamine amidotransferase
MTADTLAPYQLLLIDYSDYIPRLGRTWPPSTRGAYLEYLKGGGGVVAFHVTVGSFPEWPAFHRTLGVADNHAIGHGPYHTFTVQTGASDSPLAGMPAKFGEWGEIYNGMELLPEAHVLARAWDDPQNCAPGRVSCGSGKSEPILWTYRYGAGRVFVTTLGHDQRSIDVPEFRTSLLRGAKWAAGAVTNGAKSRESGE